MCDKAVAPLVQLTSSWQEAREFLAKEYGLDVFTEPATLKFVRNDGIEKHKNYLFYFGEDGYPVMEFDCDCNVYRDGNGDIWFLLPEMAEHINNGG